MFQCPNLNPQLLVRHMAVLFLVVGATALGRDPKSRILLLLGRLVLMVTRPLPLYKIWKFQRTLILHSQWAVAFVARQIPNQVPRSH